MANVISLKNLKRFERHRSDVNMRCLKVSVGTMKSAEGLRDLNSAENVQDKSLTKER